MLETSDHFQPLQNVSLDRMVRAVELVRDRLKRAAAALDTGDVPYAVVEDNAVAAWVSRVDEAAVRNTQDVDILLRRGDLEAAKVASAPRVLSTATSKASTCSWTAPTPRPATPSTSSSPTNP
jgi:hypothetical protein